MKNLVRLTLLILSALFISLSAKATPYASAITNNSGTIQFILNEGGATINVTFEDASVLAPPVDGTTKGLKSFPLGGHSSYSISVAKLGNGIPALISSDANQFNIWANPRGVDVNKNSKLGYLFGRTYIGHYTNGGAVPNNKGWGLYALNADQSDSPLGHGTNAWGGGIFAGSDASGGFAGTGPWRLRVAPDNSIYVGDASPIHAAIWQYSSDLNSSNQVLNYIGRTAGAAAGIHGDFFGTSLTKGSIATGDLVLWTADPGMAVPSTAVAPNLVLGPGTYRGSYNCLYRYDIGSGPLPWNQPPNYAFTMGLDGIAELRTEIELGLDGKIMSGFGRANLSNPDIQVLDPTGANVLYTSWDSTGGLGDPWNGSSRGSSVGTYGGIRVSPDGRYLASVDINNGVTIALLTNGIPDDNSIFVITNLPSTGNARGMCWDAADNIYVISSGQGLLRVYSLGLSTTTVTSNDSTGTNGSFNLILPTLNASGIPTQPLASQNYINSGGSPISGIFRITLNTNQLTDPAAVNFTRGGSAVYLTNYTLNVGTTADGVIITSTNVVFPVGTHVGNWFVDLVITPTALPVSGPTLTVNMAVAGGTNYVAVPPVSGTISIANTGPQLLFLTAITGGTMNRDITNDYAKFLITRWGDTNGPGNSAGNINPKDYTITNFTYLGTATYPVDYTARAQNMPIIPSNLPTGFVVPDNSKSTIVISHGDVLITNLVGNPIFHTNVFITPTNLTVILALTNATTGTNLTSGEGYSYTVTNNNAVTLTEIDNAVGKEFIIWSNPLTNSLDSANWTLTFASTNLGTSTVLPVVIPNYPNISPGGASNDYQVDFGSPIANDGLYPSGVMAANGWSNVLRMTVNKNGSSAPSAVNLYPQGLMLQGNYALRFDMYLSLYAPVVNNPLAQTTLGREFALFGVNHRGTNTNWKPVAPVTAGNGSYTTNYDGQWFAIDADTGSATPADFDGFASAAIPNAGGNDIQSNSGASQSGVFKHPPFVAHTTGGTPVNQWVDVSIEINQLTNAVFAGTSPQPFVSLKVDRAQVLTSFTLNQGGVYTNGTIMLGYLDPIFDVGDGASSFVYYSNVRAVELSPWITASPAPNWLIMKGSNLTYTAAATFASVPGITNTWYSGNATALLNVKQTDSAPTATNLTSTLSLTNIQSGTNYWAVFSDSAGSVTSVVAKVEVIAPAANVLTNAGANVTFTVTPTGFAAPTNYLWKVNGTNITANNGHYGAVTNATLLVTNVQAYDVANYTVTIINSAGTLVTPAATLTLASGPSSIVVTPANQTNLWGSTASFTVSASGTAPLTYRWKKGGVDMSNGGNVSGATNATLTLSPITSSDAANYTVGVTNIAGGAVSSPGVLSVLIPAPTFSTVQFVGSNVVLSFSSTNTFDTTNAFTLQSSTVVTGPYTNTPASYTTSGGTFQVTAPQSGGNTFYRLLHNN